MIFDKIGGAEQSQHREDHAPDLEEMRLAPESEVLQLFVDVAGWDLHEGPGEEHKDAQLEENVGVLRVFEMINRIHVEVPESF